MNYSEKVKEYFEKHSPEIYSFASKYGLKVDEYPQYSESWSLGFKHPKGGHGLISIAVLPDDNVMINSMWLVYVFETFSMYSKNNNFRVPDSSEIDFLKKLLEMALQEILSWDSSELEIAGGKEGALKDSWAKFKTKEEWEKTFEELFPKNYPKGYEPKK